MLISSHSVIEDVMRQWPGTIRVVLDHKFLCVGCPIACFHTVEEVCREHNGAIALFVQALNEAARPSDELETSPAKTD